MGKKKPNLVELLSGNNPIFKPENGAGLVCKPVAGLDACPGHAPAVGVGRVARFLPLRQSVLRRAGFPGAAAYLCGSGSSFGQNRPSSLTPLQ
jgi:hypothetical protein